MESLLMLTFAVFYIAIYFVYYGKKSKIICKKNTKLYRLLTDKIPRIHERYYPLLWGYESRVLTLLKYFIPTLLPQIKYKREVITASDGGQFALNWVVNDRIDQNVPMVFVAPGLTTVKEAGYISTLVHMLNQNNYRVVLMSYRGLDGLEIKTSKSYCATETCDLEQAMNHVKRLHPTSAIMLCGTSLGGMLAAKYLKKMGPEAPVTSSIMFSSPFHPSLSNTHLEKSWRNFVILNIPVAMGVRDYYSKYQDIFKDKIDHEKIMKSYTIRSIDEAFTTPIFNYNSVEDYWEDARIGQKTLQAISVPTLFVGADDDPFAMEETVPAQDISNSEHVAMVLTRGGGHVSHLQGWNPFSPSFFEDVILQFAKATVKSKAL